jgi:hypothetical protein
MKAAAPTIDRVAKAIAIVASVWFAFAAAWGMFGIPGGGHIGAGGAGNVMAAEQMIRWRIGYPAWGWFRGVAPVQAEYLCHHPYGQYYIPAALFWLFGHKDCLVHLPAVLMSATMPPMLYGIGRARWGAPLGAVAAAAYTVIPIAVGFSNFWNLETICIFGALLFFWGHSRHLATHRRRHLIASLIGLGFACSGDWAGYLMVAPTIVWAFLRAFVLTPRMTPHFRIEPYARWWALSMILVVASLAWWIGLFQHAGQIGEWLNAGSSRGGGEAATLHATLEGRKTWIDFSFTPLAIAIGKIAAPVCLLRALVIRRDEETYALALLFGAGTQYVVFKEGADVHIFWPHEFAPYFALALAQLAATIGAVVGWVTRWFSRNRAPAVAAVAAFVVGMTPVIAMAHDGVKSLWVWRRTGGRYDDNGTLIRSHVDSLYVVRKVVMPQTPPGARIDTHPSLGWGWEYYWSYQGENNALATPIASGGASVATHPFWLSRGSGMTGDEQRRIASTTHVRIYGDSWVVDQREARAPVDAYSLHEREPTVFEWLVYGGTERTRSILPNPDPWLTWEWRTHLGQSATTPPGEPVTLNEVRIAHNLAIANGDDAGADRWRKRIEESLDHSVETSFTHGVRLLGVKMTNGVEPRVECFFELLGQDGKGIGDVWFDVHSTIEARESFSLIPPSPTDRQVAFGPSLPTKLWRVRFIYSLEVVFSHRIGVERYWGTWQTRDGSPVPTRTDGKPDTTLATLP